MSKKIMSIQYFIYLLRHKYRYSPRITYSMMLSIVDEDLLATFLNWPELREFYNLEIHDFHKCLIPKYF